VISVRVFIILVACFALYGCSSRKDMAPVFAHGQPPSTKVVFHEVAKGETLYSIAWRYNLDYKKLAKANNIGKNYAIYPGQKIHLSEVSGSIGTRKTNTNFSEKPPKTTSSPSTTLVRSQAPSRSKNETKVVKKRPKDSLSSAPLSWSWPAAGSVARRFNSKNGLNKGIDIGGHLREPVFAASAGTVVYAGEGLRGYGKLIIIKHNDKYLSAYAHNHRLLVKEGQLVKRKDQIAEMGRTEANEVLLHFEIRYDGSPVDPQAYLPVRS